MIIIGAAASKGALQNFCMPPDAARRLNKQLAAFWCVFSCLQYLQDLGVSVCVHIVHDSASLSRLIYKSTRTCVRGPRCIVVTPASCPLCRPLAGDLSSLGLTRSSDACKGSDVRAPGGCPGRFPVYFIVLEVV